MARRITFLLAAAVLLALPAAGFAAPGGAAAPARRPKCFRGSVYNAQLGACACRPGKGTWLLPGAAKRPGSFPTAPPAPGCDGAAPVNKSAPAAPCSCRACPAGTASAGGALRSAACGPKPPKGQVCAAAPAPAGLAAFLAAAASPAPPATAESGGGGASGATGAAKTVQGDPNSYWSLSTSAPSQSWRDACATNSQCVQDPTGNYQLETDCKDALPPASAPLPACRYCTTFSDADLITSADAWAGLDWAGVAPKLGLGSASWPGAHVSALQMAKIWMVGTAKYSNDPAIPSGPSTSVGGPASCVAAMTVALQEGGNNAPQDATYPYRDANPFNIYDPSWNLQVLCPEPDNMCHSGGPWQVSSAWVSPTSCPACDRAGCQSLKNPICAARITFEYAKLIVTPPGQDTTSCSTLFHQQGGRTCNASQLLLTSGARCANGPFCLESSGWNSPPCFQMLRQAWASKGLPFCRLAIKACALARQQLLTAYAALPKPLAPEVAAAYQAIQGAATDNAVVDSLCPAHPGDWTDPSSKPGLCHTSR